MQTHKVILDAQPRGAVLLQEPLQQVPAGVRHVGLEHRRLVQDVVIHLSGVATVERRLEITKKTKMENESVTERMSPTVARAANIPTSP